MELAIIGATGLVGTEIIKILEEKKIKELKKIYFVASEKNKGKNILYKKQKQKIISISEAIKKSPSFVIFSSGSKISKKYAKVFTKKGTIVIDNSSEFRMKKDVKLIVPEINGEKIKKKDLIISNPNCSTIQLVLALHKIHKEKIIKRIIVSTYQAVSGSGQAGINQLKKEEKLKRITKKAYKKQIYRNVIPHCDDFLENEYTKEEEKVIKETNKILQSKIKITATAVRVPTIGGHGESVNIELTKSATKEDLIKILKKQKGLVVEEGKKYKTPIETRGKNEVFVSRLRRDNSQKNTFNMWIVADPLRKGAATNSVQILEKIINMR
tara:strand:- start:1824 stop:2801 length:978 start_codon:yes stop_codon:yes gene_type:complete